MPRERKSASYGNREVNFSEGSRPPPFKTDKTILYYNSEKNQYSLAQCVRDSFRRPSEDSQRLPVILRGVTDVSPMSDLQTINQQKAGKETAK